MAVARAGVKKRGNEPISSLLNRFNSEVFKSGVLIDHMDNMYFTSQSEKKAKRKKEKKFKSYLHNKRDY